MCLPNKALMFFASNYKTFGISRQKIARHIVMQLYMRFDW